MRRHHPQLGEAHSSRGPWIGVRGGGGPGPALSMLSDSWWQNKDKKICKQFVCGFFLANVFPYKTLTCFDFVLCKQNKRHICSKVKWTGRGYLQQ